MFELMLWVAQEPASEGYRLDRQLMMYVLAGTAILCFLIFVTVVTPARRPRIPFGNLGGNIGVGELVVALAVLGTVSALALPAFIPREAVTTILGTLIGAVLGSTWRGMARNDMRSGNQDTDLRNLGEDRS